MTEQHTTDDQGDDMQNPKIDATPARSLVDGLAAAGPTVLAEAGKAAHNFVLGVTQRRLDGTDTRGDRSDG